MKTVICFGTFDIIHPGHEYFLHRAKDLGDRLIVSVGRDPIVERIKGRSPLHDEIKRVESVRSLGIADSVLLGDLNDMYAQLEEYHPDVIALGYDQEAFIDDLPQEMARRGIKAVIVRLPPYQPERFKSSKLRKD